MEKKFLTFDLFHLTPTYRANGNCDMLMLKKSDLDQILTIYPIVREKIYQVAEERFNAVHQRSQAEIAPTISSGELAEECFNTGFNAIHHSSQVKIAPAKKASSSDVASSTKSQTSLSPSYAPSYTPSYARSMGPTFYQGFSTLVPWATTTPVASKLRQYLIDEASELEGPLPSSHLSPTTSTDNISASDIYIQFISKSLGLIGDTGDIEGQSAGVVEGDVQAPQPEAQSAGVVEGDVQASQPEMTVVGRFWSLRVGGC